MKRNLLLLLLAVLLCPLFCGVSFGQGAPWTGIIDPSRATNWAAGIGASIESSRALCVTTACNTVTGGTVTSTSLNAALASAPAHSYVSVPSGSFTVTAGILITNPNVTLRGAGPQLTKIKFTTAGTGSGVTTADVFIADSSGPLFNGSAAVLPGGANACSGWSGGYSQGSVTLTLTGCGSAPPANQFIILDQASDTTDNSGMFVCNVASCNDEGLLSQDGRAISGNNHAQQEFVQVVSAVSLGGGSYTVTIGAPGLRLPNWSEGGTFTGTQMGAWWPGQIVGVGLENLTLDHSNASASVNGGEVFYDCNSCWASNVIDILGGQRNHFWLYQSTNVTIQNSYVFGSFGSLESYGVEFFEAGTNLIQNNIFDFTGFGITNGAGVANVIGYNTFPRSWFAGNNMNWQAPPFNHNVYAGDDLYEGNDAPGIEIDNDWGTIPIGTMFRNYLPGHVIGNNRGAYNSANNYNPWDIVTSGGNDYAATQYIATGTTNSNPPSHTGVCPGSPGGWTCWTQIFSTVGTNENTNAVYLYWGARAWNILGNTLGDASYDTQYIVSPSTGLTAQCDTSVYKLGWRATGCAGATDSIVQSSVMLWGNCDSVNNACRFVSGESAPGAIPFIHAQSTPSTHTLPKSLYLPGQPSWWSGTSPFPAVGPDVTGGAGTLGTAYPNPAQQCYAGGNFTAGIMNFDGNVCYPTITAPLAYSARTDNCVDGTQSSCNGSAVGRIGSTMNFQYRPADSPPFPDITSGNASMSAAAIDADFGAYMVMATDETTSINCLGSGTGYGASWAMGSAGEYDPFSVDSKILLVSNQNGNQCLLFLNPTAIHAKLCATASPACVVNSGLGTTGLGSQLTGTAFNFSRNPAETNVLFELASNVQQVNKLLICRFSTDPGCSGQSTFPSVIRTPYVDMNNVNTSVCGSDLLQFGGNTTAFTQPSGNTWNSTFVTGDDDSVVWATGGGQDWQASWTPVVNESYIYPLTGNPSKHFFFATTVTGSTGASEPTWSTCSPTCTNNDVVWTDGGVVGGQNHGFTVMVYHPGAGCRLYNTMAAKIYNSTNSSAAAGLTQSTDAVACSRFGANPCTLTDQFQLHDIGLTQNGQYVALSPWHGEAANAPGNTNSGTLSGQVSSATWSGVAGGPSFPTGVYSGSTSYVTQDVVAFSGYFFTARTNTTGNSPPAPDPTVLTQNTWWTETEAYPTIYFFDSFSNNVQPCTFYLSCNGHEARGYLGTWFGSKYKEATYVGGFPQGIFSPGTQLFGATLPCDNHGTYRNSGTSDLTPVFTFTTCVPMSALTYTGPGYGELNSAPGSGPIGSTYTFYRFNHTFAGPNNFFSDQNNIGVVSFQGDLAAFGTDMWGTRGDQSASNITCANRSGGVYLYPGTYGPGAGLTLLTSDPVNSNQPDTIFPLGGNAGSFIYVTTTQGTGTTTSTVPTWCQTAGCTVTYTTTGTSDVLTAQVNSCRADVVIVDTLSANGNGATIAPARGMFAGLGPLQIFGRR